MFLQIEILVLFAASAKSVGCNHASYRFLTIRACRTMTLIGEMDWGEKYEQCDDSFG